LEHHSNIVPWQMLVERAGITVKAARMTPEGRLDLDELDRVVTKRCQLVAVTHCSNVTGAVTDTAAVVEAARTVGAKVLLDGAQRVPHGPIDVHDLGADFYAFSGHKMFGPTGIGGLWGREDCLERMPPFMGGGQMIEKVTLERSTYTVPPRRFEAGTPPIAGAIGLGAAAEWLRGLDWTILSEHRRALTRHMLDGLQAIPGVRIIGPHDLEHRRGVVSFMVEGRDLQSICRALDERGVAVRYGHHCAQPLLAAFGLEAVARASLALYNTEADIDALLNGVEDGI
ncbi:MAG: aminotransferase class V-fold PLP-dependent enzyme, partial [Hyphomicrobiales bacterium]